jgi:hypothetical protein
MRKLCFVLTALLLTVPAMATVQITCAQVPGTYNCAVSYNAVADGNMPRAFGLNITVSAGTITALVSHNASFWVHPGNIVIVGGNVTDEGSPVALPGDPGALGGIGTNGMTIEMGSLYDPCDPGHPTPPAASGELLRFTASGPCTVTIAGNAARGNVVNESTDEAVTNLPANCVLASLECFPGTHPDYAQWSARGKPSCWCGTARQCHGDTATDKKGSSKAGYYYVGDSDLNVLIPAWKKLEPPKGSGILGRTSPAGILLTCADIAHDKKGSSKAGYYYVGDTDLNKLIPYWKKLEVPKGSGTPPDCLVVP